MRLVEDHDVERLVDVRRVAEVLEHGAGAGADDLAQVLREGLRAGDVEGPEAQRGELCDEIDRDDRLPGAGAAGDDERDLLLVLAGSADRIHDRVVGDLLFVEEREDGLVADDARYVVEQALVRAEGRRGDSVQNGAVVRTGEARVQERRERIRLVAGE